MKREELISKWLDHNLNDQEFEAFKNLEDYDDLIKLNNNLQNFKANEYNANIALQNILSTNKNKITKQPKLWVKSLIKVAAILAICFSVYYYTNALDTTINTAIAEKTVIELPDNSNVSLNAKSTIVFNKNKSNDRKF